MRITLILAAVLPAIFLLIQVYRADRLEKEPLSVLLSLLLWGVIAAEIAALAEQLGVLLLERLLSAGKTLDWDLSLIERAATRTDNTVTHDILLYFVVVALSEEGTKYLLLRWRTWRSPEFNCCFDGVVYAVFLSLGFALWENIHYVLVYGLGIALARAVTAVPGHACFGVFMGTWYGLAKRASVRGDSGKSRLYRFLAFLIPCILHGVYDFVAATRLLELGWFFLPFVAVMFLSSFFLVKRLSRGDSYL